MKIDRKFKKTLSEIPKDCKQLIEKLKNCADNDQLFNELCAIKSWNIGKCELYHWADVLDLFDTILESSCAKNLGPGSWQLACDMPEYYKLKKLLLAILQFTALLIEHSYSRHLYNSIEYLTSLLESTDFYVILSVLNLLYVFSKRSVFINRLAADKKQALIQRLLYLAESWGGKENGLDLVKCCCFTDLNSFPSSATTVNFEYSVDQASVQNTIGSSLTDLNKSVQYKVIKLDKVNLMHENPAVIMERVIKENDVPEDKHVLLYTYIRLAHSFPNYEKRKLFVQTRLQSLSILVYSGAIQDHVNNLLYDGLIEELVDVLNVKDYGFSFPEIKASSLKTLTAIIHLEKTNKLNEIIETTQASSYHGLLPTLVRKCVEHLIDTSKEPFPHQFATSLFSFLYHLATYDTGGDALVKCGIMETLLKVVNHYNNSHEYIMFVTRAVRVIDLITNLDMNAFETHNGLTAFINRLEYEVNECRKEQPFQIEVPKRTPGQIEDESGEHIHLYSSPASPTIETSTEIEMRLHYASGNNVDAIETVPTVTPTSPTITGITIYHQRSALLKSMLNFFKKSIADSSNNNVPNLGDSIRHMMEFSLPNSLKHIISNSDYYGPSLFVLATDVVQLFIFQEPSQLSQLQDNGLTDVILHALLKKNVPATREVLSSLPTVFSALCLNTRGLNAFIANKPFDKLFQVLLSPDYLQAMKRRRNTDQLTGGVSVGAANGSTIAGTASQLGSAMDELMRHQPSLRIESINSIIKLLYQLIDMGKNPLYVCQRSNSSTTTGSSSKSQTATGGQRESTGGARRSTRIIDAQTGQAQNVQNVHVSNATSGAGNVATNAQQSSDDEDDDYENTMMIDSDCATTTNLRGNTQDAQSRQPTATTTAANAAQDCPSGGVNASADGQQTQKPSSGSPIESVPLLDYITNIMKFIEAILSNNSTDDHCKEFVKQKGLQPLLEILSLPNLPIDFPNSQSCQSVSLVCKAILNLAREQQVIEQALLSLQDVLKNCEVFFNSNKLKFDGSLLIHELSLADNPLDAVNCPSQTPLLHAISSVHSFIYLLITLGKTSQNDVRNLTINKWGSTLGITVLKMLCKLYMSLIWESSMLLWLSNEEQQQQQTGNAMGQQDFQTQMQNFEFNKNDLERLKMFLGANVVGGAQQPLVNDNDVKMDESGSCEPKPSTSASTQTTNPTISYSKLLRPLFNCASKLGRSLCELFGLLVKLSAGTPWKSPHSRRNQLSQQQNSLQPSQAAVQVSSTLAEISTSSFQIIRIPEIEQLNPKFRLTFYICSVGFTSSILFDEMKRPYHLMLQRFEQCGGLKSLFDAFYWALSLLNTTTTPTAAATTVPPTKTIKDNDKDKVHEGILEFIETWLALIQKLVNTKNMLETRHSLQQQQQQSQQPPLQFDPIRFLYKIHKEAFNAVVLNLWDKSFLRENFLSEAILNILCQIFTGDGILQKKLQEREQQTIQSTGHVTVQPGDRLSTVGAGGGMSLASFGAGLLLQPSTQQAHNHQASPAATAAGATVESSSVVVNLELLMQITSMGFSVDMATEALQRTQNSLEQALEYCCTQTEAAAVAAAASSSLLPSTMSLPTSGLFSFTLPPNEDLSDIEQMRRAIAMSFGVSSASTLGNQTTTTANADVNIKPPTDETSKDNDNDDIKSNQLDKVVLDRFVDTMLPGLMRILDNVPETVYRVCDLIVVIIRKYGDQWRDQCLNYITNDTLDLIKHIVDNNGPVAGGTDQKLASRLLLFSLLFEEMQFACATIINATSLLDQLVTLVLQVTINRTTTHSPTEDVKSTPMWLTALFILIDLIEKASLATKRKAALNDQYVACKRVWKWYEERQNRWITYAQANNKSIDDSYKNGDQYVRIVVSRKHYLIAFNSMLQINEETSHKRPIMLCFEKPTTTTTTDVNDAMQQTATTTDSATSNHPSRPSSPIAIEIIRGLTTTQASLIVDSCVDLITMPIADADCLHAILRLVLRLTRQHDYAIQFAKRKGPQAILNLTQKCTFMGFASLITLIFRHICEDEANLRLTMEKAIRLALTGNQSSTLNSIGLAPGGIGTRELHNVLRILGPAICRQPDIFCEIATNILRIVIRREEETQPVGQQQQQTSSQAHCLRAIQAKLMPSTSLPDYAHELVIDLLNYLVKPTQQQQTRTTTTTSDATQPQPQPLILKSGILRILSELVRSYAGCAKIITSHVYKAGGQVDDIITDDINAIAFLLDNFLAANQVYGDRDCSALCRLLIVALASCNHCLDSQNSLVHEVKLALHRAVALAESPDKHIKIQSLAGIINTMIETCPPINTAGQQQPLQRHHQQQQQNFVNNMMKIMHKKGLINDLAHVPHNIDLSCSKCIETINAILKPLETMTKTLNITTRKRDNLPLNKTGGQQALNSASGVGVGAMSVSGQHHPLLPTIPESVATSATATAPVTPVVDQFQAADAVAFPQQQQALTIADHVLESSIGMEPMQQVGGNQTDNLMHNTGHTVTDEHMIDLNMTEMEPQQSLPQDVDMPSVVHHHHHHHHHHASRREIENRVFDRVIEVLNQENDTSDDEYDAQNPRIIHIEADNDSDQIRIQIQTGSGGGGDDGVDGDGDGAEDVVDDDDDADNGTSGDEEDEFRILDYNEDEDDDGQHHHHHHRHGGDDDEIDTTSDDDDNGEDDDGDDSDEEEDDDDDDANNIDEELVEGSDGRSPVPSDMSDVEHETATHGGAGGVSASVQDQVNTAAAIASAVANALDETHLIDVDGENSQHRRRRQRQHDHADETDNEDDDDDDDDDECLDDESDDENNDEEEDEDMELVDDEEEIIENEDDEDEDDDDDAIDENENDDDDEDDEDDDDDDDDEDDEEHDDTSEYYDAYNEMLDFMNDDNDNDTDDILMHLEDLWQNPGHRFVLGQGIGGANSNARAIQIAVSGGTSDATLPPHPLSAPTIHPLLVHHGDSVLNNSNGNSTGSHIPAAVAAIGNGLPFGSTAMSSSRLRQQQQHQQQQVRSRISRFIIPGLNLQLTATTNQQPTTTTIPTTAAAALTTITQQQANNAATVPTATGRPPTALPYNTLNEILQGFETQLPSASYDMFVGGLFNPQMNVTHDMLNAFNGTGVGGGGGVVGMETGDNGGANLYLIRTPLARWTEECTMLDSHSIHNAVLIVKPRIIELLERYRADELDEKRQKKAQDDEKLKRAKEAAAAASQSALATTATSTATVNTNVDQQQPVVSEQSESLADHPIEEQVVATVQPPQEVIIQESLIAEQAPSAATEVAEAAAVTDDTVPAINEIPSQTNEPSDQTQADVTVSQVEATNFLINSLSGSCNIFTLMDNNEKRVAIEALRISDNTRAAHELATMHITDYPQNLVYIDGRVFRLPSGIDPSFLSALPDNLRREVVLEQFRIQGIDTRRPTSVAAADTQSAGTSGTTDPQATGSAQSTAAAVLPVGASTAAIQINPEFLAALPPQIQEELIAQQRLEQQQASAAAAAASVNDDDNSAFMRSLPASLRQAILFDMDQSQIGALPDDLASEARGLQQQQQRERDLDLFASHRTNGGFYRAITGTNRFYNAASSLVNDAYFFAGQSRDYNRLRRGLRRLTDAEMHPMVLEKLTRGGRQLLDHESLACLLVLLFVDDTKLNSVKLHRVVRNICIHGPSRAWIIKALLTILEKVSGKPSVECIQPAAIVQERRPVGQGAIAKTSTSASNQANNSTMVTYQPSWLNMSIDGAFGSKTNVFTILRSNSKKAQVKINETNTSISINHQASPAIIKQVLEILSTLARAANFNFFPRQPFKTPSENTPNPTTPSKANAKEPQFWDLIIKLDQSKNKASKLTTQRSTYGGNSFASSGGPNAGQQASNMATSQASTSTDTSDVDTDFTIENSPLARLMSMLDYSTLKNNSHLMDKMFTCLAHASAGISFIDNKQATTTTTTTTSVDDQVTGADAKQHENEQYLSKQIELVVSVLKNKQCSQDGLNQAYTLLNNLSKINGATRNLIIKYLLEGTRELGFAVCQEIDTLLDESKTFKTIEPTTTTAAAAVGVATTSSAIVEEDTTDSVMSNYTSGTSYDFPQPTSTNQQNLIDRYSNLVISSPKAKQTHELQLPSMSKLVEKNSNQKFFVRLIKLIINLRETIEKEAKKKRQQQSTATATAAAAAATSEPVPSTSAQLLQQAMADDEQQQSSSSVTSKKPTDVTSQSATVLNRLSADLDLDILWNKLSQCLSILKTLSDPYAVLILQQTVEAFFYVHATRKDKDETKKKEKETKEAQLAHLDSECPMSPAVTINAQSGTSADLATATKQQDIAAIINSIGNEAPDTKKFLEFALTHRTVLNHILRQTSNNLSDEPYSVLIDFTRLHTHILDFDVKRRYFRQELDKLKDNIRGDDLAVHVRRTHVFDDSYRELNRRSAEDWKHRFYIVFEGEEGQDAGGLLREWYLIISKEIFNPDYALFMINPGDRVTYMPNPSSHFNPNHLSYFRFIGRIIAKAIFDNKFLDCYFTRAFYKHILGVSVKYTDMESVDNEFYKNLVSILESDIELLGADLTFSIDISEFGVTKHIDLKPDGHNLRVTNENKAEYVRLVCQEKMIGSIRQQVAAFLQGFYEIIPKTLISIFNEQELELLVSGLPEIDLEDLRRNTEYHKYTTSSLQVQWFWRALKSFDKEDQAKFLQFVTGTSKVPLQGFAKLEGMNGPQKFQIHKDDRDTSRLPCAHTCFNQLDLPAYENYEKLRTMLLMAITECSTGFGLA